MRLPQYSLALETDMIVDLFAGGGGASVAIEMATGRYVDIAINHDPQAISVHTRNHPHTKHFRSSIHDIDPIAVTQGRPVSLLWASPDCRHFSKSKGGKPVSKQVRSLAWVVVKWASKVKPAMIMLENVEEFTEWCPLGKDSRPCRSRKGETFKLWVSHLERLGYAVEWRQLRACDYGTPTSRNRLFLVARRDKLPIVWPKPSHGDPKDPLTKKNKLKPWLTAADIINWDLPVQSIFDRDKPLKETTLKRIAKGIFKYVIDNADPFIIHCNHTGDKDRFRGQPIRQPLGTITSKNGYGICIPYVSSYYGHKSEAGEARGAFIDKPLPTQTTANRHALVNTYLSEISVASGKGHVVVVDKASLSKEERTEYAKAYRVYAFLLKYYGTDQNPLLTEPLHTITTKDRFALVTVHVGGKSMVITDICMRMLQPEELYRAQGFPDDYVFTHGADDEAIPKHAQTRMCGNSVPSHPAVALLRANVPQDIMRRLAA